MIGKRFGKLVITGLSTLPKTRGKGRHWDCLCDCGNTCIKTTSELNAGCGKSCGCITKTHGMSETRQYNIWYDMKRRCEKETRRGYENYGGRGITYSPSWETFEGFWVDMAEGYSDELELERVDVNGDYTKDNCIWITMQEQAKNKRMYSNNSLGMANISVITHRGIPTIKARIQETETKKRHVKTFSLNLYSYDEAVALANKWLDIKRQEFGYKESHGT